MDGNEQLKAGAFAPIISGGLEARLARSEADIDAAQALRYRIFFEEMGARPFGNLRTLRRDFDDFDAVCDHILVTDHDCGDPDGGVVGRAVVSTSMAREPFGSARSRSVVKRVCGGAMHRLPWLPKSGFGRRPPSTSILRVSPLGREEPFIF